jgi:hypothetical protein
VIIEDTARDGEARAYPKLGLLLCSALCAGFWMPVNTMTATRSIGRRPKSAKARNRSVVRRRYSTRYGDLSTA